MGGILSGLFGTSQRQDQRTRPDATQQALNEITLDELSGLFADFNIADFAGPNEAISTPGGMSQAFLSQVPGYLQRVTDYADNTDLLDINEYIDLGLDETSNYISQIATPEILSAASLQGLESSGAIPEAIAKATAGIALPFIQGLPGANQSFASTGANIAGLPGQYASTLFPLTDFPRQLQQQDFMRQQGVVQTGLTGIPFAPGSTTSGSQGTTPFFNLGGIGSFTR